MVKSKENIFDFETSKVNKKGLQKLKFLNFWTSSLKIKYK